MRRSSSALLVAAAFACLVALYFYRLGDAPIYLAHDEVMFGVEAHEIAWHGRDVAGQTLPLYMPVTGGYWAMPAHIYFTAVWVRLFGTNERTIRASSAAAALLAVFMIYAFGCRVFRHRGFAALAAGMFALTPAFFIDSRLSTDHHYVLLAVGAWLLSLARWAEDAAAGRSRWLIAAGASLGLGFYTYAAALPLMPIYLVLTAVMLRVKMRVGDIRPYVALAAGFAVAATPLALFLVSHRGYVGDVATMYRIYDARRFSALQGAHELINWTSLSARSDVYFSYLNPSMLFFSGAGSLIQSTRQTGFFLFPFIALLPGALLYIIRRRSEWYQWLFVAALLTAPVAASIVDEHAAVQRALAIAPFGCLIVADSVMRASRDSRRAVRAGVWVLVAWLPVSFGRFYADYLGDYRVRSGDYFEQNIRGALEAAMTASNRGETGHVPICISRGINPFVDWYWKFYLLKHDAAALEADTSYFDASARSQTMCAPNSIVVAEIAACDRMRSASVRLARVIAEPNGSPSFCVFSGT